MPTKAVFPSSYRFSKDVDDFLDRVHVASGVPKVRILTRLIQAYAKGDQIDGLPTLPAMNIKPTKLS